VAELVQNPVYRDAVLQGLVFSVGGVDAALGEAAGAAIIQHCDSGRVMTLSPMSLCTEGGLTSNECLNNREKKKKKLHHSSHIRLIRRR
jgi:hypothetical protein